MNNLVFDNIVIDPAEELIPFISISAIDRKNFIPKLLDSTPLADKYLSNRFGAKYVICRKCREALSLALSELKLTSNDTVTIFTTTSSPYISSCVTKTIEQYCNWSREVTPQTKAILVNHEFGYVCDSLAQLKSYGFPIIEDCAHSFFTNSQDIGRVGDFVIYSLPKSLSLQLGGILVYRDNIHYVTPEIIDSYVRSSLEHQIPSIDSYIQKRFENYDYYCNHLGEIGITPFLKLKNGDVPGAFLFTFGRGIDYRGLKTFMNKNGVDSSVFFGNDAYFVPIHQNLTNCELEYICKLLKYFYYSHNV